MELMIFDRNINFKGLLEGYSSFRKVRRYSSGGGFELHCSFDLEKLNSLKIGNIIWANNDLEAGYIRNRHIKLDEEGKEVIVVRGKLLTGYLGKRIIWGTENIDTTAESAIRQIVSNHAISPNNLDRRLPLLELGEAKGISGSIQRQISYKNLLEEVEKIASGSEIGIRAILDANKKGIVFDIYEGVDKSGKIVFSTEFENILEQEYAEGVDDYRNVALIAGEGEGSDREIVAVGDTSGLDRREVFVDAKNLQSTKRVGDNDVVIPRAEYIKLLENRGKVSLSEMVRIQTFDSRINTKSNYVYKEDYDLGDIVTVKSERWDLTIDTRITEIEEVYEEEGLNVFVTFGNEIPTIIDKIKRVVSN